LSSVVYRNFFARALRMTSSGLSSFRASSMSSFTRADEAISQPCARPTPQPVRSPPVTMNRPAPELPPVRSSFQPESLPAKPPSPSLSVKYEMPERDTKLPLLSISENWIRRPEELEPRAPGPPIGLENLSVISNELWGAVERMRRSNSTNSELMELSRFCSWLLLGPMLRMLTLRRPDRLLVTGHLMTMSLPSLVLVTALVPVGG